MDPTVQEKGKRFPSAPLKAGAHRSFEERFAEQFGVSPKKSDIRFDNEELDWGGPQGAEVW